MQNLQRERSKLKPQKQTGDDKMNEQYQKVAYIGLRRKDGSYAVNIPLYVKLDEVNKKDMDESREEIIHKVTEIMMRRYEKQLAEIMNSKRPPPTETK